MTIQEKAAAFRALHTGDNAFIMPNPYDAGTAKLLENTGFKALATSSAGFAFTQGKKDNAVSRDDVIGHIAQISAATSLPVSADLENGFFDAPEEVARTITLAAGAGAVGGSIEDTTNGGEKPQYDTAFAADRIRAAAEAKSGLDFDFTLTGRADNFMVGNTDLADIISRLQAYQEAGADVLFAPGLTVPEDIASVIANTDRPVNIMMGIPGVALTAADLSKLGVKRISVGVSLACAALGAFQRASQELMEKGTFGYANDAAGFMDINSQF